MAKQKKSKPVIPEMVSLSEIARRAGVSRTAVTLWFQAQECQGIKLVQPRGRRGKVVDASNPLVMRYIENTMGKSKRFQDRMKKSDNTLRKLQYQAEKLRLENIALREKYVETKSAFEFFDKLLEAEVGVYDGFSDRVLNRIETEFNLTIPPEDRKKAKAYIDQAIQDAHIMNCRLVEDFKKKYKPR